MNPVSDIFARVHRHASPDVASPPSPEAETGAVAPTPAGAAAPNTSDQLAARRRTNLIRSDEQAVTCQLALAHSDPKADEPDSGDFLRQQIPAAYQRDVKRVRVYGLCAKRAFRAEQARLRSLAPVTPPDDLPPIAA